MRQINIHEAKTHLSRLVEEAAAGEEIVIAKAGKPVARLMPMPEQEARNRKPGMFEGRIKIHDNFDDPLPPEIAKAFGID
jgi:prevent-host-death family protein